MRPYAIFLSLALTLVTAGDVFAESPASLAKAQAIFNNLNQVILPVSNSTIVTMAKSIDSGDLLGAAHLASADDHFITLTVRQFAAVMKTRGETANVPLGDFDSTFMGFAKNDMDLRHLLTDNISFTYKGITPAVSPANNTHYLTADSKMGFQEGTANSLAANLVQGTLSTTLPAAEYAGVLTSRDWFAGFGSAGTNRALFAYSLNAFECTTLAGVANAGMPSDHVRQDVDVASANYQVKCATCHNVQDWDNPYNHYAFTNNNNQLAISDPNSPWNLGQIGYNGTGTDITKGNPPLWDAAGNGIASKVTRNSQVNPLGYRNTDSLWRNMIGPDNPAAASLGLSFTKGGDGVNLYGQLLANSTGFPLCMAKRAFSKMCLKKDYSPDLMAPKDYDYLNDPGNAATIQNGATYFSSKGYSLRALFEYISTQPQCLPAQ